MSRKKIILSYLATLISAMLLSQSGNVGINTSTPSSTLNINGSFEANYSEKSGNYTLTDKDHYVAFTGTAASTFTLPASQAGDKSFGGRIYIIKNLSSTNVLTLAAPSGQTIRQGGTEPAVSSITIPPGFYSLIVANNNSSGSTYDITTVSRINNKADWILAATGLASVVDTAQNVPKTAWGDYTEVNGSDITVTVPPGYSTNRITLVWNVWGDVNLGNDGQGSGSVRYGIKQTKDGVVSHINSVMMYTWALVKTTSNDLPVWARYASPVSYSLVDVAPGTYTFKLKIWRDKEYGTINALTNWGVQGKVDVYVRNN